VTRDAPEVMVEAGTAVRETAVRPRDAGHSFILYIHSVILVIRCSKTDLTPSCRSSFLSGYAPAESFAFESMPPSSRGHRSIV
jgi:hypothetical protein